MKKALLIFIFFLPVSICFAQQNGIQFTVRWNIPNNRYEVFAKPNFTSTSFTWGPSQVGLVLPASTPNQAINVTSVNAGNWVDKSRVFAPLADTVHDFHGVVSDGDMTNLTNGVETLLFTFTLPDGQCRSGVRIFVNGSDPSSSASGMAGGDFKNTIFSGVEAYGSNYNNTGTLCNNCNITAPELIK